MTPEQEILGDLLGQIEASRRGLLDAAALIPDFPADVAQFEHMPMLARVASTALLKSFEQLQEDLGRAFRTVLRSLGVRLKGLFPLDIAHHMVELDIVDDPRRWLAIVKLRNELVHEYPADPGTRLGRLRQASDAIPFLVETSARLVAAIEARGLLHDDGN